MSDYTSDIDSILVMQATFDPHALQRLRAEVQNTIAPAVVAKFFRSQSLQNVDLAHSVAIAMRGFEIAFNSYHANNRWEAGTPFSLYCTWWLRQALADGHRRGVLAQY